MAQSARESRKHQILEILGTTNFGPTNHMGEMANPSKTSDSRSREYHYRHVVTTQTNDSPIASGTEVRDAN